MCVPVYVCVHYWGMLWSSILEVYCMCVCVYVFSYFFSFMRQSDEDKALGSHVGLAEGCGVQTELLVLVLSPQQLFLL